MVSYTPKQKFQVDDSNLNVVVNDAHRREFISYDRLESAHVRTSDMSDSSEISTGYSGSYQGTFFWNKYFTSTFEFQFNYILITNQNDSLPYHNF